MSNQSISEFVDAYVRQGLCLIPVEKGQKGPPQTVWKKYQDVRPSNNQLEAWFKDDSPNVAIVCGPVSENLCILDFDSIVNFQRFFPDAEAIKNETPVVMTHRGVHVWVRSDRPIRSFRVEGLVEVKAKGSYCLAPPSIHPEGGSYSFASDVREPKHLHNVERYVWNRAEELGVLKKPSSNDLVPSTVGPNNVPGCAATLQSGVKEGDRNNAAFHLACYWLNICHYSKDEVAKSLAAWNQSCVPPLEHGELSQVLESANRGEYVHGCCLDAEIQGSMTLDDLADVLSCTIKEDRTSKLICFIAYLCTYTENNQVNIGFEASSSTGKSYISQEVAAYFPSEDVKVCGYTSPMAFFHDAGTWDAQKKQIILDMERKIFVFLDQPHDQLLQRLRPIMSHDSKETLVKITDKSEKKGLRTKNILVRGFSTFAFCATKPSPDDQEKTRLILLSPESTQEKLVQSINLQAMKKGDGVTYRDRILSDPKRRSLLRRIRALKDAQISDVLIEEHVKVASRFSEEHNGHLVARHQRDFEKLVALVKGHALLNFQNREKTTDDRIKATQEDVDAGFQLYGEISESNELGLDQESYRIFKTTVKPKLNPNGGLTLQEILEGYYSTYGCPLDPSKLRNHLIPAWEAANLVHSQSDPTDRRRKLLYPLARKHISRNVLDHSGVDNSRLEQGLTVESPPTVM